MIQGVHTMFYSSRAEELRAFLRDKLNFPHTDVGDGWLIFDLPEADMGCHPTESGGHATPPAGTHAISFYCDDIEKTVAQLRERGVEFLSDVSDAGFGLVTRFKMPGGVEFTRPINDHGYGLVTYFKMPGELEVQLYQPHYRKRASAGE